MSNGHIHVRYLSTTSKCGCSHVVCMTVVAGDIGADSYFILQYISINFLHPMSVIWHVSCLTHLSKTSPSVQNVPPAMSRVPCGVQESPLCVNWVSVSAICQKRICLSKTCLQPYLMCCKVKKSLPVNSLSVCVSHLFIWARHLQGLRPLGLDTQCTSGLPKVRGLRPEYT